MVVTAVGVVWSSRRKCSIFQGLKQHLFDIAHIGGVFFELPRTVCTLLIPFRIVVSGQGVKKKYFSQKGIARSFFKTDNQMPIFTIFAVYAIKFDKFYY